MSLRLKTVFGVAIIEAILLIVLITLVLRFMSNASEESLVNHANNMSSLFATTTKDAVISYDLASIESFVSEILKNDGVLYARVLDSNGYALGFEKKSTYQEKPFNEDKSLDDVVDNIFDIRADISEGGALYGAVEMGISTSRISKQINQVKRLGIGIVAFEMSLVALFSFVLGIYLTKQLIQLRKAAKKVAEGDLDHQVEIKGNDEVSDLARSFNQMINSLNASNAAKKEYQLELESLNKDLEERVKTRTQQLVDKNSELEQAYDDLKDAQVALLQSEKMASLGQMAAGVAHEINNPMAFVKSNVNSMSNYIDIFNTLITHYEKLYSNQELTNNQIHLLNAINKIKEEEDFGFVKDDLSEIIEETIDGVNRVTNIVQGLKSFSHIDQVDMQESDINACLKETLKIASNAIKYNCEVHTDYADLPSVTCNPGKLNQVFLNLITNASQAMLENGHIYITTSTETNAITVSIKDTGQGIAPEHLEKLFEPFFTTKPIGEGTGLGLSISHGIIEEHGGEIQVASELGKGTEFTIILPLQHGSIDTIEQEKNPKKT